MNKGRKKGSKNIAKEDLGTFADDPDIDPSQMSITEIITMLESFGMAGKVVKFDIIENKEKAGESKRVPCGNKNCEKVIKVFDYWENHSKGPLV